PHVREEANVGHRPYWAKRPSEPHHPHRIRARNHLGVLWFLVPTSLMVTYPKPIPDLHRSTIPGVPSQGFARFCAVGVATVSFATLLLELSLTRLFSVVLFYHFAFLAISVA